MYITPEQRKKIYEEEKSRIEGTPPPEAASEGETTGNQKKPRRGDVFTGMTVIAAIIISLMLTVGQCNFSGNQGSSRSLSIYIVTMSEFNQIQHGMSYRAVCSIIDSQGELISSGHVDGIPGIMDDVDTVMYQWVNYDGSNMNAMFQNDKLINKAQWGLR